MKRPRSTVRRLEGLFGNLRPPTDTSQDSRGREVKVMLISVPRCLVCTKSKASEGELRPGWCFSGAEFSFEGWISQGGPLWVAKPKEVL